MAPKKVRGRHLSGSSAQGKPAAAVWTWPEDAEGYIVMCYLLQCLNVHAWAELSGPMERTRSPPASSLLSPQSVCICSSYKDVCYSHTQGLQNQRLFGYGKVPSSAQCLSVCLILCF